MQARQTLAATHAIYGLTPPFKNLLPPSFKCLHPIFRRAPVEGTVFLQNPASCDIVRERGHQIFGECTRVTISIELFPRDYLFPDIVNLFIHDVGDANDSNVAAPYVFLILLFEILLEFLLLLVILDYICLSTVLVDYMIRLILIILIINYLLFSWTKSTAELVIYST